MSDFPKDIYTEPDFDVDTLKNLGPLRPMAGFWEGKRGLNLHPVLDGSEKNAYVERIELHPIDGQTNGPQLLYGLRYHTHIVKVGEIKMFHDQVGYWLWEPATETIIQTLAIPRGQVAMAVGHAKANAKSFELIAKRGTEVYGICSNPFLEHAFKTVEFRIKVTIHANGTWSYDEDTVMKVKGKKALFHHTDRNTLTKIGEPTRNPQAR